MERLERAEARIAAGVVKKALGDLWYAEAEHRADVPALEHALALVNAITGATSGRTRKDAEDLASVLASDLERARRPPFEQAPITAAASPRSPLGAVAAWSLIVAIVSFLIGLAGVQATFFGDESSFEFWVAVIFFSLASFAVSIVAGLALLVRGRRCSHGQGSR